MMENLPLSSIGRRLLALILDGLIIGIPCAFASHVIPFIGGLIVWFFYAPVLESSEAQATLGKYLLGIQVVDLKGQRISLRVATIRNLLKCVSSAILFLGYFVALFSSKSQTLHDLLAETLVVEGKCRGSVVDAWIQSLRDFLKWSGDKTGISFSSDALSQLERLQALRQSGALTEEEFQEQKRKILLKRD